MGLSALGEEMEKRLCSLEQKGLARTLRRYSSLDHLEAELAVASGFLKRCEDLAATVYESQVGLSGDWNKHDSDLNAKILDFTKNDYLCLGRLGAYAPFLREFHQTFGLGSEGSRLLGACQDAFQIAETYAASTFGFESAIYMGSGFSANVSLISLLSDFDVTFFSDQLNHASTVDGIRRSGLSKSSRVVFSHRNYDELESKIENATTVHKIIFSESVYSMDGTVADLSRLIAICKKYSCVLVLDEAHSVGVSGHSGLGFLNDLDAETKNNYVIGVVPLGKAPALSGAFVLGPDVLIRYFINHNRAFIYSTAPSPVVVAASVYGMVLMSLCGEERKRLSHAAKGFRDRLSGAQIDTAASESHIVPVVAGGLDRVNRLRDHLMERGMECVAVRPPTVASGTERIRLSLHSHLSDSQFCDLERVVLSFFHKKLGN